MNVEDWYWSWPCSPGHSALTRSASLSFFFLHYVTEAARTAGRTSEGVLMHTIKHWFAALGFAFVATPGLLAAGQQPFTGQPPYRLKSARAARNAWSWPP